MKKILSFSITFLMLIMLGSNIFITQAQQNIIDSKKQVALGDVDMSDVKPVVVLENTNIPEATRGNTLEFTLKFKNVSSHIARNFVVAPEFGAELPFEVKNLTLERSAEKIYPDKVLEIKYNLRLKGNAEIKTYPVNIKYSYTNSMGTPYSKSQTVYIKVKEGITPEKVVISNLSTQHKVVSSKDNYRIQFKLRNEGARQMNDVRVSLEEIENEGLEIKDKTFIRNLGRLEYNNERNVTFNVGEINDSNVTYKANSEDAKVNNYKVVIKVSYKNSSGENKTFNKTIYLKKNDTGSSNLSIQNVVSPYDSVKPNQPFEVKFNLKNNGDGTAKNIQIIVDGGDKIIPISQNKQIVRELNSKATKSFNFKFQARSDAETRNYPISIEVIENGNKDKSIKQYVGVYIVKNGTSSKGVPKIIVSRYEADPSIVSAGQEFDLYLSLLNTNVSKQVKNIKVYLTAEQEKEGNDDSASGVGNVFTPVDSSNTFFIDSIQPKETIDKSLTLYTIPSAVAKTYTLTVNLEYEDADGKAYTAKELIGIPVSQPAKLQIGEIKVPEVAFVGQDMQLQEPIQFYNTGKVTMSNFMVKAIGDFDIQNGTYFIGNFEAGNSDYFEPTIIPNKEGKCTGTVIFSYDEPDGKHNELKKKFTINVQKMDQQQPNADLEKMSQEQMKVQGSKSKIAKIIGAIAVLAVIAIIIIKIKKKKSREKDMSFDE